MNSNQIASTGFKGLDDILDGLRLGDNVVFRVDAIDDYRYFVGPFVDEALAMGRQMVYIRFGDHAPLLEAGRKIRIYELESRLGFEPFASRIYRIITEGGPEAFYVFDCLSDLASAWTTDLMAGNFFRVTCPYLFELNTVAYFSLMRDRHSPSTIERVRNTTQVLLDVMSHKGKIHVQPLKVWERSSPTMFLPHRWEGEVLVPLANSIEATDLLTALDDPRRRQAQGQLDHWDHLFLDAEELLRNGPLNAGHTEMVRHICRHIIGQDERVLDLAQKYFSLNDLLTIKSRLIGTGFIGGKAVGMLLAHHILRNDTSFDWGQVLEPHDSYYVGSNVYYSFIVHNDLWNVYMQQKTTEGYFRAAGELREKMKQGIFPDSIRERFRQMLEYYGQYPIIIRSSSLLEDGFGNAFAGKYDSFFRVNQGSPEERLVQLEDAIRGVFASTMSEAALAYRRQRGLNERDEQMALLIQRVSGSYHDHFYFPELAGVGVSYNTFVWDREMSPQAGMLRLVLGLGTRAVDRSEADYPRIVALDAPGKRPHQGFEDMRKYTQRDVDILNVNSNNLETVSLLDLYSAPTGIPWETYAVRDREVMGRLSDIGRKQQDIWLLTFDDFLSDTGFTRLIQRLLKTIEKAYQYPVDIEFTVNFTTARSPKIGVVQCRPLQTKGEQRAVDIPTNLPQQKLFFRSEGHFMGGNISEPLEWIIWVEPSEYILLTESERYSIARLIGNLNKLIANRTDGPTLLLGPGRWGTSTPSLGIPVTFAEISNIAALAEVAYPAGALMPELSFGSHFFQDLVETDIFYLALFPEAPNCFLNIEWLATQQNELERLLPSSHHYQHVVKVCHPEGGTLRLMSDVIEQQLVCTIDL